MRIVLYKLIIDVVLVILFGVLVVYCCNNEGKMGINIGDYNNIIIVVNLISLLYKGYKK